MISPHGASKLKHVETVTRFDFEAIPLRWVTLVTVLEFATCTVEE
jgi:hypothetical protein